MRARKWWASTPPAGTVQTTRGDIVTGDGIACLRALGDESADIVFLDPPFNLGKKYGSRRGRDDRLAEADYDEFLDLILAESTRVLRPGAALFVYHIPRRAYQIANKLDGTLLFRHWIAIAMKNGFAREDSLYPAHYALLYFTKGPPATFRRSKIPLQRCPHCGELTKDYGGYAEHVKAGVHLSDFWEDISPVRHRKHRNANELPMLVPARAIELARRTNGLFVDPFAGSGTAVVAAKAKGMRFVACDIDPASIAVLEDRLARI